MRPQLAVEERLPSLWGCEAVSCEASNGYRLRVQPRFLETLGHQMNGSWEIKARNQVLVGILHVDTTTIAWSLGLRRLIIPGPEPLMVAGVPYDMGRNIMCQRALEAGVDFVFMLDSDVVCPPDTILRLMAHRQPIVSGVYYRRSPPHGIPVMLKRQPNGSTQWLQQLPPQGLIEVDLVGAGCLLIHRSVLEKLPPIEPGHHWFCWRVDRQGILPPGECLSEDFSFNLHAQRHGYKVLVDTSIRCRHIGFCEAGPELGRFVPCEVA